LKRGHVVTPSGYAWYCIASNANHDVVGLYASAAFGGEHRINATIEMLHRAGAMKQKKAAEQYLGDNDDMPGLV